METYINNGGDNDFIGGKENADYDEDQPAGFGKRFYNPQYLTKVTNAQSTSSNQEPNTEYFESVPVVNKIDGRLKKLSLPSRFELRRDVERINKLTARSRSFADVKRIEDDKGKAAKMEENVKEEDANEPQYFYRISPVSQRFRTDGDIIQSEEEDSGLLSPSFGRGSSTKSFKSEEDGQLGGKPRKENDEFASFRRQLQKKYAIIRPSSSDTFVHSDDDDNLVEPLPANIENDLNEIVQDFAKTKNSSIMQKDITYQGLKLDLTTVKDQIKDLETRILLLQEKYPLEKARLTQDTATDEEALLANLKEYLNENKDLGTTLEKILANTDTLLSICNGIRQDSSPSTITGRLFRKCRNLFNHPLTRTTLFILFSLQIIRM